MFFFNYFLINNTFRHRASGLSGTAAGRKSESQKTYDQQQEK
jgi:hypothetical protein